MLVAPSTGQAGYPGYQFENVADEETASNERKPIENRRGRCQWRRDLPGQAGQTADLNPSAGPDLHPDGGERPRGQRRAGAAEWRPATSLIGVKPLFNDKNVAGRRQSRIRCRVRCPRRQAIVARRAALRTLKIESRYQWYRRNSSWEYEPVKSTSRVADGDVGLGADKPSRLSFSPPPGRYRLDVKSTDADGPITSVQFDVGWYSDGSATRRTCWRPRSTSRNTSQRYHGGVGECALRRQADHQRARRPPADDRPLTSGKAQQVKIPVGKGLGHRRLCDDDAAPPARCRRPARCRDARSA